jgi:hypothetical protein
VYWALVAGSLVGLLLDDAMRLRRMDSRGRLSSTLRVAN